MFPFVFAQEPYPAADYQGRWAALGLLILAVVALWYVAVVLATRTRSPQATVTPVVVAPPPLDPLAQIAEVEARSAAGQIDSRRTHAELSTIVRRFVSARTGIPADRMHLGELQSSGVPMVPELLAVFYPAQFAETSGGDSATAVAMARSVVHNWPVAVAS